MAVARAFQTGWELQNLAYDGWSLNTHDTNFYQYETSSPAPNTGDSCLELVRYSTTNGAITTPVSGVTQLRANIWTYIPSGTVFIIDGFLLFGMMYAWYNGLNNNIVMSIRMNSSNFLMTPGNNTLLEQTAAYTIIYDAWVPVGLDMYSDNSGYCRLWYNGVMVMDHSGDTLDSQSAINLFAISPQWGSSGIAEDSSVFIDDLTIWTTTGESALATPPEYKKYYFISPNGNGNYSNFVGQDSDNTDNYLNADEIPPDDDTTYNVSGTSTNRDSYAMGNETISETIDAVIPIVVARGDGSASNLQIFLRENSTDDDGASQAIGVAYSSIWERFTTDPGGGAWDNTEVNNLEVGVLVP